MKVGTGKIIIIISSVHMCMILTYGISIQASNGGIISDQSARGRSVIKEIGLTRAHLLFPTQFCHHNGHTRCTYVIYYLFIYLFIHLFIHSFIHSYLIVTVEYL